jgi:hypothetical protein
MLRWILALGALALSSGCSEASPTHEGTAGSGSGGAGAASSAGATGAGADAGGADDVPVVDPSVELGTPAGDDGLGFAPLMDGAELRLQTFGQGGTHVLIAVRCLGFDKRAFVSATLTNSITGVVVEEPAPARPQLLYCHDEGVCDLVPYLVHASGLTKTDEEKNGLLVRLTTQVHTDAGVMAEASLDAVLSTADL